MRYRQGHAIAHITILLPDGSYRTMIGRRMSIKRLRAELRAKFPGCICGAGYYTFHYGAH